MRSPARDAARPRASSRRCAAPPARRSAPRRRRCRLPISMTSAFRSLSSLALSRSALRNFPGLVGDARDAAGDRRAVDVAVEDVHEDRNAREPAFAQSELRRRHGAHDRLDPPVRRADDQAGRGRHDAHRIAEEDRHPAGEDHQQPEERREEEREDERQRDRRRDERPALAVDVRNGLADGSQPDHPPALSECGRRGQAAPRRQTLLEDRRL